MSISSRSLRSKGLTPARARLVSLCQRLNFGRVDQLQISDGEPVIDLHTHVVREIKFGGDNSPRSELALDDFVLKAQVVEMFATFDALQDGMIETLEIKHGLPFRMVVAAPV